MSPSYHKRASRKWPSPRTRIVISNLKKENAFLLKTLNELARHHNDHNRIIEKFVALVSLRPLSDNNIEEDTKCMAGWRSLEHEENQSNVPDSSRRRMSCYAKETEEIKDKLVSITARCQSLENSSEKAQECSADVQASDVIVTELQIKLKDALVKNQQWVEYDKQREDYVKSIMAKISWLEKHLHDVCNGRASDRNDFLLSEKKKVKQVEQYYEGLIQKAEEEFEILLEQVNLTQQALTEAQRECRQKQCELEELRQQLKHERNEQNPQLIEENGEYLTIEAVDLQDRLNKERRKSTTLELQTGHLQKYFLNHYHKAQKQMTKFKQMIEVLLQDLHDERENCTYLKQQLEFAQTQTEEKKSEEKAEVQNSAETSDKPPLPPKPPRSRSCILEESFMECPMCHMAYPASQYNELIEHLDYCPN